MGGSRQTHRPLNPGWNVPTAPLRHWHCPGMGGFCRQNSLENPLPRQDANPCDWNPSRRGEPRNTKYPHNSAAKKNIINTARGDMDDVWLVYTTRTHYFENLGYPLRRGAVRRTLVLRLVLRLGEVRVGEVRRTLVLRIARRRSA